MRPGMLAASGPLTISGNRVRTSISSAIGRSGRSAAEDVEGVRARLLALASGLRLRGRSGRRLRLAGPRPAARRSRSLEIVGRAPVLRRGEVERDRVDDDLAPARGEDPDEVADRR